VRVVYLKSVVGPCSALPATWPFCSIAHRDPIKNINPAPSARAIGSVVSESAYDGLGRRIVKTVTNSGDLDATYHYLYSGHSIVEVRNGSDAVLKQYVWGLTYVDEIVQTTVSEDPIGDPAMTGSGHFRGWAMQDANFNVLGIVDASGALVERYEYTPYGQRTVYFSPGSNDNRLMAATSMSRRVRIGSTNQPYGRLDIGHQGLMHEDETLSGSGSGLVYNRARHLHTELGRFVQRDPLDQNEPGGGYQDGINLYQYVRSSPLVRRDQLGLFSQIECYACCDQILDAALSRGANSGIAYNSWNRCIACCGDCPSPQCCGSLAIRNPQPLQPVPPNAPSLWSSIVRGLSRIIPW
jgi:RHS repeat-associated protein